MGKVRAGDPLEIESNDWNGLLDVLTASRLDQLSSRAGAAAVGGPFTRVRNDSGSDRERFDVLALSEPVVTPAGGAQALKTFKNRLAWKGIMPTLAHVGNFVVLIEPVKEDRYAWAIESGLTVARVNVGHASHLYGDIADGSARLTSNWYGAAKIRWKEAGTGDKWAVVRLGPFHDGPIDGVANEDIPFDGSGSVNVWYGGFATSSNVTAWWKWMTGQEDILAGTQLEMRYRLDTQQLRIGNAGCFEE